jgi:membrane protein DedA with SNARE-associated domain
MESGRLLRERSVVERKYPHGEERDRSWVARLEPWGGTGAVAFSRFQFACAEGVLPGYASLHSTRPIEAGRRGRIAHRMSLQELLTAYGPLAIFVVTFFEGETILIVAGFAAQQHLIRLDAALLAAFVGSMMGDQLYFHIGRRYGQEIFRRRPYWRLAADRALKLLLRYQNVFILSFRFLYGVRMVSSFAIGLAQVSYRRFTALNMIAAAIWSLTYGMGGYLFGRELNVILGNVASIEHIALGVLALLFAGFWMWRYLRRRRLERATMVALAEARSGD